MAFLSTDRLPTDERSMADGPDPERQMLRRLDELATRTPLLVDLSPARARAHLAEVQAFLHDEVLAHASAEEITLFPVVERVSGARAVAQLTVEHDTVRDAVAELEALVGSPLTAAVLYRTADVLRGIELLLHSHLDHESDALHLITLTDGDTS